MNAGTETSSSPRQIAARKGAATRRLQSADDRRLAAWIKEHTDPFDYERVERGLGDGEHYFRAPNAVVEDSLNGPRREFLCELRVDDVRRHRAGQLKLRCTPTHSQHRASAAVRLDADAHLGQADAPDLIAFLDRTFFAPRGCTLHAEPSDRGMRATSSST